VRTLLERLHRTGRLHATRGFEYPYKRIARVLATSEENAPQLVTRARGHLSGDRRVTVTAGERQRLLDAIVAAAQAGNLARLERTPTGGLVAHAPEARVPVAIAA
jgi:RNA polymerase sigma-70 factor, ECF subfamily